MACHYPNKESGIKVTGNNDTIINNTITGSITGSASSPMTPTACVLRAIRSRDQGVRHAPATGSTSPDRSRRRRCPGEHDPRQRCYIGIHINGDISEGGVGLVTHALIEGNRIYNNGQNGINADGLQSSVIQNNLIYGYPELRHLPLPDRRRWRQQEQRHRRQHDRRHLVRRRRGRPDPRREHGQHAAEQHPAGRWRYHRSDQQRQPAGPRQRLQRVRRGVPVRGHRRDPNPGPMEGADRPGRALDHGHADPVVRQSVRRRLPPDGVQPGGWGWDCDRCAGQGS